MEEIAAPRSLLGSATLKMAIFVGVRRIRQAMIEWIATEKILIQSPQFEAMRWVKGIF